MTWKKGNKGNKYTVHNLDLDILNNYLPFFNLPYLSKQVERAIAQQVKDYMHEHELHESLQSVYCMAHSTETEIIYVSNNLLQALDSNDICQSVGLFCHI